MATRKARRGRYVRNVLMPKALYGTRVEGAYLDVRDETALARRFNKRRKVRFSCPHCRAAGITGVICCRAGLRQHLLDHRLAERFGRVQELYAMRNERNWFPLCESCAKTGWCWRVESAGGLLSNLDIQELNPLP